MSRWKRSLLIGALLLLGAGRAAAAPSPAGVPPLEVTRAAYAEYDSRTGVWLLRGSPVVVTRGATQLEAPEVRYDERRGVATAVGGVTIRHEGATLQAARAEVRLREDVLVAQGNVAVTAPQEGGVAQVTAGRLESTLALRRLVATERPSLTHRESRLSAVRLDFDVPNQTVQATGGAELLRPDARLTAGRIDVELIPERALARENVRLVAGDLIAVAPLLTLDQRAGTALLTGGVVVRRGADTLTAAQVAVDLRAQRALATGTPRLILDKAAP